MDTIVSDDRPDLENKSVALATIKHVAVGAVIGGAVALAATAFPSIRPKGFTAAVKKIVLPTAALTAAVSGMSEYDAASRVNATKDKVRPYVEKLEADRDRLATLALNGNAPQGMQKG